MGGPGDEESHRPASRDKFLLKAERMLLTHSVQPVQYQRKENEY
jgi:hypothetical protein